MPTVDQVVGMYMKLRADSDALGARHAEEMRPLSEGMEKCKNWLLQQSNDMGVDSFKTEHGTAYKTVQTSVTVADKEPFKHFLFAKPVSEMYRAMHLPPTTNVTPDDLLAAFLEVVPWDLMDLRAGKKGVQTLLDETGEVPPGVNVTRVATINVRKS
jgi:hypothetical protein